MKDINVRIVIALMLAGSFVGAQHEESSGTLRSATSESVPQSDVVPACPADNPICNPHNPAPPVGTSRRSDADGRLTQRVRESILIDGAAAASVTGLSVSTRKGKVTLRGTAQSEATKVAIGERAAAVVGVDNVVNELSVSP